MTPTEIARLAHAINDLRPDWPIASLTTFINRQLGGRAYRDAAVALTWVAVDSRNDGTPASDTPKRVLEAGPWWRAAAVENPGSTRAHPPKREEECPRHPGQHAGNCGGCATDALAAEHADELPEHPLSPNLQAKLKKFLGEKEDA